MVGNGEEKNGEGGGVVGGWRSWNRLCAGTFALPDIGQNRQERQIIQDWHQLYIIHVRFVHCERLPLLHCYLPVLHHLFNLFVNEVQCTHACECLCMHTRLGVCVCMLKTVFPNKSLHFISTLFIVVCVCVCSETNKRERGGSCLTASL